MKLDSVENSSKMFSWLMNARLTEVKVLKFKSHHIKSDDIYPFLQKLCKLTFLYINIESPTCWMWLSALRFLSELKVLHITTKYSSSCSQMQVDREDFIGNLDHTTNSTKPRIKTLK